MREPRPDPELPTVWRWLFHGFRWYAPRTLRKQFTALRVTQASAPWPGVDAPILVVLNHPSWWDPVVCTALSFQLPTDAQYAAIDAAAMTKHKVFSKIGFVPIDMHTLRGAAEFVRVAGTILSGPGRVLWVTAQGRFTDPRARPLALKSGVGHLAKAMPGGHVVPLALEYPFWDTAKPEALAHIGPPVAVAEDPGWTGKQWAARIEVALTEAADALAADALTRDPGRFTTLLDRDTTVCDRHALRRRMLAAARGRSIHEPRTSSS